LILSILIPSTYDRQEMTEKLYQFIDLQSTLQVEILVEYDNKEISIGAKRQKMLERAKGKYVVFIDSDDWLPDDYVESVLKALESNPDCVGHKIECSGTPGRHESASNRYPEWCEKKFGFDYTRTPYPKTPILKSICLQIGFKDMRYGEDHDFSIRLKESGLIKTEVYLNKVLYFYRYKHQEHNKKYGINR
jgi:glycosyltransferase involved in cell wall biosynthesis